MSLFTVEQIAGFYTEKFGANVTCIENPSLVIDLDEEGFSVRSTCNIVTDLDRNWSRVWSDVEGATFEEANHAKEQNGTSAELRFHQQLGVWCEVECEGVCAYFCDDLNDLQPHYDFCSCGKGDGHFFAKNVKSYVQFDNEVALIFF